MFNNSISILNSDQVISSKEPFSLFDNQEVFSLQSYSDEDFEYCSLCLEAFQVTSLKKNRIGKFYCHDCYESLPICGRCSEPAQACDFTGQFCDPCEETYETDFEKEVEDEENY